MALAVAGQQIVAVAGFDDVLAVGDTLYACGPAGRLAVSRDAGLTWQAIETGTDAALHGLALAPDGAVWLCGDNGYLACMHGGAPVAVDVQTPVGLVHVHAMRDALAVLGDDGVIRRWTAAGVTTASPGNGATALLITARGWIAVGRDGIARSSDGAWYTRVSGARDLTRVVQLRDGRVLAVGDRGCVLASRDDGRTWTALETGLPRTLRLTCARRWQGGVVVGDAAGPVARMTDAGAWQVEPGIEATDPVHVAFDRDDADDAGDDSVVAVGRHGVERALDPVYHGAEPWLHLLAAGAAPLDAISIYRRDLPTPHFHVVTFGFTEQVDKDSADADVSGYGFELSLRVARGDDTVPTWAIDLVRALARYVFATGNRFAIGHTFAPATRLAPDRETVLAALAFADDPELDEIRSDHGRAAFLEVVGITADEYALVQEWSTEALIELLAARSPLLVTDLTRRSLLDDPHLAAEIHRRVRLEGSSEAVAFAPELGVELADGGVCIVLEQTFAEVLARGMRGRLQHGRRFELRGRVWSVVLEPAPVLGYRRDEDDPHTVILEITPEVAAELEDRFADAPVGRHPLRAWSRLSVDVR